MATRRDTRPTKRRRDTPPPKTGPDERDVLLGFLDYLRASVLAKTEGVPEPAIRTPGVASGTNLLGLIKHLTHVERRTFLGEDVSDWPATFRATDAETADDVLGAYRQVIERANVVIMAGTDLALAVSSSSSASTSSPSLRWALVHMIEETGRHAGHADILRELLYGRTGR